MTTDFRWLCTELLAALETEGYTHWGINPSEDPLVKRARAALATPPPKPPTDKELGALADEKLWPIASEEYLDDYDRTCAIDFARAVLEMWGR